MSISKIIFLPFQIFIGLFITISVILFSLSGALLDNEFYTKMIKKADPLIEYINDITSKNKEKKEQLTQQLTEIEEQIFNLNNTITADLTLTEKIRIKKRIRELKKQKKIAEKKIIQILKKEQKFISRLKNDLKEIMPEINNTLQEKIIDAQLSKDIKDFIDYLKGTKPILPEIKISLKANGFHNNLKNIIENAQYQGKIEEKTSKFMERVLLLLPDEYKYSTKKLRKKIEPIKKYIALLIPGKYIIFFIIIVLLITVFYFSKGIITFLLSISLIMRIAGILFPFLLIISIAPDFFIPQILSFFPETYISYIKAVSDVPQGILSNLYSYLNRVFLLKWGLIFASFFVSGYILKKLLLKKINKSS